MPAKEIQKTTLLYRDQGNGTFKTSLPVSGNKQFPGSLVVPFVDTQGDLAVTSMGGDGQTPRYAWEISESDNGGNPRPQTLYVENANQIFGSEALRVVVTGTSSAGGMFLWCFTNVGVGGNDIKYLREFLENPQYINGNEPAGQTWGSLNKYNRLRLWYRPGAGQSYTSPIGNDNCHIGTYLRATDESSSSQESDNWHFYHYYHIPYLGGNYAQVIVDPHPNHQRGANGAFEHGIKDASNLDPTNSPNHNYMDLLTNFYFKERNSLTTVPSTSYVDGVEIYEDPNTDEDINHIYALWGAVDATNGDIVVGWRRLKNEDDKTFDVKYAPASLWENGGWASGNDAPNGQNLDPENMGGYNGVEYRDGGQIDTTGLDAIYIAIKHQDEPTNFREIRIPLTTTGYSEVGL